MFLCHSLRDAKYFLSFVVIDLRLWAETALPNQISGTATASLLDIIFVVFLFHYS